MRGLRRESVPKGKNDDAAPEGARKQFETQWREGMPLSSPRFITVPLEF